MTLIFGILLFMVFGKMLIFALKACWGITRIFFSIVFLPITLIAMVVAGAIQLAFPILIIIAIIVLLGSKLA